MYPDSPYAVPIGSFRTPVPLPTVDPNQSPVVYIPINCDWIPYILGALKQLLLQATWDTTDPVALNLVQMRVFTLMSLFDCNTALTKEQLCGQFGTEQEFDMGLRVDCDCNVFVTCCDGTEKQILTAQQVKDLFKQQPGAGTPQPTPGGGCQAYPVNLPANNVYLVPTVVNSGDTIELTGADGAANDGGEVPWHCPDGSTFFAGICTGGVELFGTDPLPSVGHMRVLAKIDGTYYDLMAGPITVPGGVSNAQVTLQVNDDVLSDNLGSYSFSIRICNNQPASFSHVFNFALTQGGWMPNPGFEGPGCTTVSANYTPGVGWTNMDCPSIGAEYIRIIINLPSTVINTFSFAGNIQNPAGAPSDFEVLMHIGGVWTTVATQSLTGVSGPYGIADSGPWTVDAIAVRVGIKDVANPATLTTFTVTGQGPDPF